MYRAYDNMIFFKKYYENIYNSLNSLNENDVLNVVNLIKNINYKKGKLIIVGNGGSAAIASHLSIDFTKAAKIRAINFNESSLLTCFSNDYGYENWVDEALGFYADKEDIVILISSSGNSKNIVNGALKTKKMGLPLITFSGFSSENDLKQLGDYNFWVDSTDYNLIETVHQTWGLSIIDYLIKNKG